MVVLKLISETRLKTVSNRGNVLKPANPIGERVYIGEESRKKNEGKNKHGAEKAGHIRLSEEASSKLPKPSSSKGNKELDSVEVAELSKCYVTCHSRVEEREDQRDHYHYG